MAEAQFSLIPVEGEERIFETILKSFQIFYNTHTYNCPCVRLHIVKLLMH